MKVISRLLCHGNPRIKVMPYCFDRWRQWVKIRKQFKLKLAFTSTFASHKRHALGHAFRKWRNLEAKMRAQLANVKHSDLSYMAVKNEEKIKYLSQAFMQGLDSVEDLTAQRDLLLVRYVGSQKLALSSVQA